MILTPCLCVSSTSLVSAAWQQLYNLTLASLPGAYLLVAAALTLATLPTNLAMKRILDTIGEHTKL